MYQNVQVLMRFAVLLFFLSSTLQTGNAAMVISVSQRTHANFTTIQQAVDAAPSHSLSKTLISIDSGTYTYVVYCLKHMILLAYSPIQTDYDILCREKVVVHKNKTNLIFQGKGYRNTIIEWNDTAKSAHGTGYSASVHILGTNFTAYNISFQNTSPRPDGGYGEMAVAINVEADQAAFLGCGFFGFQDTLLDKFGKHYYKDCFIDGATDFIWGNGRALFEECTLNVNATKKKKGFSGIITAHARPSPEHNTGFSFVGCKIIGSGNAWLGRAYRPYARVVFINTKMADVVSLEGWNDFRNRTNQGTVYFGEYNSTGPGANSTGRVPYSKQLSLKEMLPFSNISYIEGEKWLPFM
ncbi:pectinesterase [Ranunculus cassubicifolius]